MQGVLKREKWKNWFEACEHTEPGWLEEAWAAIDRGEEEAEARKYYKGGGTVRVTVHKGRDAKVSMRPLHHLTRFLHTMPTLKEGEGVAVTTENESRIIISGDSRSEEMDAMAEQECFFGTNAMPNKPVCRVCEAKGTLGTASRPWGGGKRLGEESGALDTTATSVGALARTWAAKRWGHARYRGKYSRRGGWMQKVRSCEKRWEGKSSISG